MFIRDRQKSVQEQPKKSKRKGFLGIFGKKEEAKPTATTTMPVSYTHLDVYKRQVLHHHDEVLRLVTLRGVVQAELLVFEQVAVVGQELDVYKRQH